MDLEELRWFTVFADTEHVTEAAHRLGIPQPTLSRALARLESHAGVRLFDRTNRRLRLNCYGTIMAEHARRCVTEMQAASERVAALRHPESGRVRLCFLHSLANWFVPEQLRRFREGCPDIRFDLAQGAAHELANLIACGICDLAITACRPDTAGGWLPLFAEKLCLAVPSNHPLAPSGEIRLGVAATEPIITLRAHFELRHLTDALWSEEGEAADIVFEADEISTMEGLVAAGLGVAVVPAPVQPRSGVAYVPLLNEGAEREVGLSWDNTRELAPPAERFATFLRTSIT